MPSSGSAGKPIAFGAYGSGAKPIIDGNDLVNCVNGNGQSYLTFENIEGTQGVDFGFLFVTCNNIQMLNCDAHDCGNDNVNFFTGSYDCSVTGGEFYAGYQRVGGSTIAGIEIGDDCYNITLRDVTCRDNVGVDVAHGISVHDHVGATMPRNITIVNATCYGNGGHGIHIWKQSAGADTDRNIVITSSLLRDNTREGLRIHDASANYVNGVTVRNSILRDNGRYAGYVIGDNVLFEQCLIQEGRMLRFHDVVGGTIYNCTFYLTTWGGFRPIDVANEGARTQDITVKNCIIYSPDAATYHIAFSAGATTNADVDYNLYFNGSPLANTRWIWDGVNKNWANWLTDSGQDANGPAPADPTFTNAGADDFTLQPGSPAINEGIDVGLPYNGVKPDLGAFETA